MTHYLLLVVCKNTAVILIDNTGWIISEKLYIFKWKSNKSVVLCNHEASRRSIFTVQINIQNISKSEIIQNYL